jgi:hypothetical protein
MPSECPYCHGPIDLMTGGWVCVECWKRWPLVATRWPEDAHQAALERIEEQRIRAGDQ